MPDDPTPAPKRLLLINSSIVPPGGFRYIQPETGRLIQGPSWRQFRENVVTHRKGNKLPVGTDLDAELQDWLCRHIPDAGMHCYEQGRAPVKTYPGTGPLAAGGSGYQGQEKWKELHVFALTERPEPLQRVAWLANFTASLPCGDCRRSWRKLVAERPLSQKATPAEFFAWTVDRHNDVNAKLGKPILPLDAARALYV